MNQAGGATRLLKCVTRAPTSAPAPPAAAGSGASPQPSTPARPAQASTPDSGETFGRREAWVRPPWRAGRSPRVQDGLRRRNARLMRNTAGPAAAAVGYG